MTDNQTGLSVDIINHGSDTTALTEAWFSGSQEGNTSGVYDRVYAIHCTSCMDYPKFPTLIEYNTFDSNCIYSGGGDDLYRNPVECNRYIGESINIGDISITKVIFPAALKKQQYVSMLLYSGHPAVNNWYCQAHSSGYMVNTNYCYKITVQNSNCTDLDTIVQFTNLADGSLSPYSVLNCIHTSNYSNPHTDQISHIGSMDLYGYMTSVSRYAAITSPFNGIVIGNTLIANDYSTRYIGDQVLLDAPSCIASNCYYICLDPMNTIATSCIIYPGRDYSYLVLAGPISASSLDTAASVVGVKRDGCVYTQEHPWDEWDNSCTGIDICSFFNPTDGHLYTCIKLSDMGIKHMNIRFTAIENEAVYHDYDINILVCSPTYTTLTFAPDVTDPVALLAPEAPSDAITSGNSWDVSTHTDLTYFECDGGRIITTPSYISLCYCADVEGASGFYVTSQAKQDTAGQVDNTVMTDVVHAHDLECLSGVFCNPECFPRGVIQPITLCTCLVTESTNAGVQGVSCVYSCTPQLYFTVAPTGIRYCCVSEEPLEYTIYSSICVGWITEPYLTPDISIYPNATCASYVWDTCRDATSFLEDTVICAYEGSNKYLMACEMACEQENVKFFSVSQSYDYISENTIQYKEYGYVSLGCALEADEDNENGQACYVDRPFLIKDASVVGGWRYPEYLCISTTKYQDCGDMYWYCIPINTYYCNTYFTVPEGTGLKMHENTSGEPTYYLEGDSIIVNQDVVINATPYGANHSTPTYYVCSEASYVDQTLSVVSNGWHKNATTLSRECLAENPVTLFVTYPSSSGCINDVICACFDVYVCYDIESLTLESYDSDNEAEDIYLCTDNDRKYIRYQAPAPLSTCWNLANLVQYTPKAATFTTCYTIANNQDLNGTLSVSDDGILCLTTDNGMPSTYGRGAVTVTAAQCSNPNNILQETVYICVQYVNPEIAYTVTFDNIPDGIIIYDIDPNTLTGLQTGTVVSFKIENDTGKRIDSVKANGEMITANDELYEVTVNGANIRITVTLTSEG